jgi:cytochrome c553
MTHRHRLYSTLAALLTILLVLTAGCNKGPDSSGPAPSGGNPSPSGGPPAGANTQTASVESLFQANCANCHKMGNLGGGRAPDLSKMGAEHDAEWIAAQIKDPKTHKPSSKMPPFASKMSEADIQKLADHLASLK